MTTKIGAFQTNQSGLLNALRSIHITRKRGISVFLILLGILMFFGVRDAQNYDTTTILTFEPGPVEEVTHVVVHTRAFIEAASIFLVIGGALGIAGTLGGERRISWGSRQGFSTQQASNWLLLLCAVVFVPTIIVAAAAGERTNIMTVLSESLRLATPLAIGAMAGIWCERSGVVNIAIEGMMLIGACLGFTTLFFLYQAWPDQVGLVLLIAVIVAVVSGGLTALLHAWLSITFRTDQIISGTVINILALGGTSFIRREFLLSTSAGITRLPPVKLPVLSDIPIVGEAFFSKQPIFYLMFVVIAVTHIVLFHTRWGLRMRAVGEHPHAADTLGINVNRTRWISVLIGGLIAGLAGAWFSLEATGRFDDSMTRGAGFIALAAMIFGKWSPIGAFGGALLFGFAQGLDTRFQALNVPVPVQFLQMVPYIVTIVVLAGLIGKAVSPKADGVPYVKE